MVKDRVGEFVYSSVEEEVLDSVDRILTCGIDDQLYTRIPKLLEQIQQRPSLFKTILDRLASLNATRPIDNRTIDELHREVMES
jgi:copper homeostasis protein CutC